MLARLLSSMHMAAGRTFSRCLMACWLNWHFLSALRLRERVLVVCVCRHLRLEPFCGNSSELRGNEQLTAGGERI